MAAILDDLSYILIASDQCIFKHDNGSLLVVYVDDFLVIAKIRPLVDYIKRQLAQRFKLKDLGPVHFFLSIRIIRERSKRQLFLLQESYLKKVISAYHMEGSLPVDTPLDARFVFKSYDGQALKERIAAYQSLVSSLMWIAT